MATAGGDVVAALGVVATRLEAVLDSNRRLEAEVAALRSEVEGLRALPPGASPELIDRALEVEMASERSPAVEAGQRGGESTGDGRGAAEGEADGLVVRAARWLERRLRGGGGAG
jgi:cell division septum initiation protein DivIVA